MRTRVVFYILAGWFWLLLTPLSHAGVCDEFPLNIDAVKASAKAGDAYCQAVLALEYIRGTSGEQNDALGHAWSKKTFENEDPLALYMTAFLYRVGSVSESVEQNDEVSVKLNSEFVQKTQSSKDANILLGLGFVRRYGRDDLPADNALGCQYMLQSAEAGHPHGMYQLALCIEEGHFEEQASTSRVQWLKKAEAMGHPHASEKLGELYLRANDTPTASAHYQSAARNGSPELAVRIGKKFEAGLIGPPDWKVASEIYSHAAKRGYGEASYRLGLLHLTGFEEFPADKETAIAALKNAHQQGYSEAKRLLDIIVD